MVNGHLFTALDWKKREGEVFGQYSYQYRGTWFVVKHGPGFANTHRVTQYDDAGLQWLKEIEGKGEFHAQD